jgi:hypothetical protein
VFSLAIVLAQRFVDRVARRAEAVRVLRQAATLIDFEVAIDDQGRLTGVGGGEEPDDTNWELSRFAGRVLEIDFGSGDVGEREAAALRDFPRLRVLNCGGANMSPTALAAMGVLPSVEDAWFDDISFNNVELGNEITATLSTWPRLKRVSVSFNKIDDAGISRLSRLSQLSELDVAYTLITNRGLMALCNSRSLTSIDVCGTAVDDQGLYELHRIPSLREVWYSEGLVTKQGVDKLSRLRPDIDFRVDTWKP